MQTASRELRERHVQNHKTQNMGWYNYDAARHIRLCTNKGKDPKKKYPYPQPKWNPTMHNPLNLAELPFIQVDLDGKVQLERKGGFDLVKKWEFVINLCDLVLYEHKASEEVDTIKEYKNICRVLRSIFGGARVDRTVLPIVWRDVQELLRNPCLYKKLNGIPRTVPEYLTSAQRDWQHIKNTGDAARIAKERAKYTWLDRQNTDLLLEAQVHHSDMLDEISQETMIACQSQALSIVHQAIKACEGDTHFDCLRKCKKGFKKGVEGDAGWQKAVDIAQLSENFMNIAFNKLYLDKMGRDDNIFLTKSPTKRGETLHYFSVRETLATEPAKCNITEWMNNLLLEDNGERTERSRRVRYPLYSPFFSKITLLKHRFFPIATVCTASIRGFIRYYSAWK